jgi:aminoglycoside phosphotransferase (APT) family kinase protein
MSGASRAVEIVAPNVRDLDELARVLAGWLSERLPAARDIRITDLSYPLGAGMSHETILFDASWREDGVEKRRGMVVRIKPSDVVLYLDDIYEAQYAVMRLLHRDGRVRVAKPLWIERRADILGAPFFVMANKTGRVPVSFPSYAQQGWLFEATPAERRRAWEEAVTQFALIQTVPLDEAGFLALPGGMSGFDQELDRWRRYLAYVDPNGEHKFLQEGFQQLVARLPTNRRDGILWGDARIGNMMFGPDFRVVAVMDWEAPGLGGGLHDLGWWLVSDFLKTTAQGLAPLGGMGSRDDTIALWRQISGCPTDDIAWYEAFAFLKMEMTGVRLRSIRPLPRGTRAEGAPGAGAMRMIEALG